MFVVVAIAAAARASTYNAKFQCTERENDQRRAERAINMSWMRASGVLQRRGGWWSLAALSEQLQLHCWHTNIVAHIHAMPVVVMALSDILNVAVQTILYVDAPAEGQADQWAWDEWETACMQ